MSSRDCHDTLYPAGGGNTVVVAIAAGRRPARSVDVFIVVEMKMDVEIYWHTTRGSTGSHVLNGILRGNNC